MTIEKTITESTLNLKVCGRLDTTTAPKPEAELKQNIGGITELTMDFSELVYLSSAGLRVLLSTQKLLNRQGKMVVKNGNDTIMEVFEMTGFTDILTIK